MPHDLYPTAPTACFILSNVRALECAAVLLGGPAAQKRCRLLFDDIAMSPQLTRRLHRELDVLDDLLSLRHVSDETSIEASRFSQIDPMDPAVEDICVLLDGLRDARAHEGPFP
ncbi:hypothetical protein [Tropicibacter naphthalenivorans]|uniref:Uncharacterized protein n=1 Tax=Tropicibacter naphthalenivorans TaxID=441103 RepID=A0A0P1GKZ0_9RHOB|nr:hypothetical protein [Tropicibacter naphthalenivorans]CUH82696.1 hypothetical protein TRN7648_04239 [Tropicibacter naphthalenivorans]SMD11653.1 hypothetical protein SAMN04488093_1276 [Tropicibacter naphthalenivorans]